MLKEELPPHKQWFKKFKVRIDLGFLGFVKDYICQNIFIPFKKPKNGELTDEQKRVNKEQASERITVEHSIGGMKRYRILSDRLRMHGLAHYDELLEVCAGLWNFYLSN